MTCPAFAILPIGCRHRCGVKVGWFAVWAARREIAACGNRRHPRNECLSMSFSPNFYARLDVHMRSIASAGWQAIPLRLIVGIGFMQHGYAKLARGPDSFTAILHALGMPMPALLAWATIGIELFGGLAVFLGLFIPLASVPMAIVLAVAIFTVHLPNGFSSIKLLSVDSAGAHFGQPGYETDLLYLAGLAGLILGGSGPWALDRMFRPSKRPPD